jgi:hypothetical protein
LRGKVKNELEKELSAHVFEQERELQLQGCSEEKIAQMVFSQFNTNHMAQEFIKIYNKNYFVSIIQITIGLVGCFLQ